MTGFLGRSTLPYFYEGKLHYSPGHFSCASKRVEEYLHARVALACVSRPDKDGYVSFGASADYMAYTIHNAPVKIAEINDQLPFVYGSNLMHISEFDVIVEGRDGPPTRPSSMRMPPTRNTAGSAATCLSLLRTALPSRSALAGSTPPPCSIWRE